MSSFTCSKPSLSLSSFFAAGSRPLPDSAARQATDPLVGLRRGRGRKLRIEERILGTGLPPARKEQRSQDLRESVGIFFRAVGNLPRDHRRARERRGERVRSVNLREGLPFSPKPPDEKEIERFRGRSAQAQK